MRVRNREIRARRKRKDETIKAAEKTLREQYANKPVAKKPTSKPAAKSTFQKITDAIVEPIKEIPAVLSEVPGVIAGLPEKISDAVRG